MWSPRTRPAKAPGHEEMIAQASERCGTAGLIAHEGRIRELVRRSELGHLFEGIHAAVALLRDGRVEQM